MHGSSAINEIKVKCGICSTPHVISGVGRTIQGKIKYFRNGRSIRCICVSSLEVLQEVRL